MKNISPAQELELRNYALSRQVMDFSFADLREDVTFKEVKTRIDANAKNIRKDTQLPLMREFFDFQNAPDPWSGAFSF